jgi:polyisoprenoid-binding protein YceI
MYPISHANGSRSQWFTLTCALATAAFVTAKATAQTAYQVNPNESEVTFTAIGKPGFLRINGKGAKIEGTAKVEGNKTTGVFETKLDSLVTGMDLRDQHMKETYLETKKFPVAKLTWSVNLTKLKSGSNELPFTGTLNLHGVDRPVSGTALVESAADGSKIEGEAEFKIKLTEYKIQIPSYLGVVVAEDVDVKAVFKASAAK